VPWFDPQDLLRGMEAIPIPICDLKMDIMPFLYMPYNKVHEKASLNFNHFLPKIGYRCDCRTHDCLMACVPCSYGLALGGEIVYKEGGILKDCFLHQGM